MWQVLKKILKKPSAAEHAKVQCSSDENDLLFTVPEEICSAIAAISGALVSHQKEMSYIKTFPVSGETVCRKKSQERTALQFKKQIEKAKPGDLIPGQGIYMGKWQPKDRDGASLGKVFNVFAAPEDLKSSDATPLHLTFHDTVYWVDKLKDWHGYNGAYFHNDRELIDALKNRSYNGGWFIPPVELACGSDWIRNETYETSFFALRKTTHLKEMFKHGSISLYWTCSEISAENSALCLVCVDKQDKNRRVLSKNFGIS